GGADSIIGYLGNAYRDGGAGNATVHGGSGNDSILGGSDNDSLMGDAGDDTISGDAGNDIIDGGAGVDSLLGGSGSDAITVGRGDRARGGDDQDVFTINASQLGTGSTFTVDGGTGAGTTSDHDSITLGTGLSYVDKSQTRTLDADGDSYSGSFQITDGTNTYTVNFTEIEGPICFARGSEIETLEGPQRVEDLRQGDMILTRDNGHKPISWIGSRSFRNDGGKTTQKLGPIRVRAGALGNNRPNRDLYLSPQHRILVRSQITRRMFGEDEVLVAVKQLLQIEGVEQLSDFTEVEYFHILLDQHEIVYANGLEAESLHTGPEAIKSLPVEAQEEIFMIFPELAEITPTGAKDLARFVPRGKQARKLAERQQKNRVPLQ
ncbi:MAG: Hint domain-containing protein, partial [Paracoccus sp. (in: a-proteobacteria)]